MINETNSVAMIDILFIYPQYVNNIILHIPTIPLSKQQEKINNCEIDSPIDSIHIATVKGTRL